MTKFGNVQTSVDGLIFASKLEARRYGELVLLQRAGVIAELACQPSYTIHDGFRDREGRWVRPIVYKGDFRYTENGRTVVEDTKGHLTKDAALKIKMFKRRYPEIKFVLVRERER